jgi:hypothetical protein
MMKFLELTREEAVELEKLMLARDAAGVDAFFESRIASGPPDYEELIDTIVREVVQSAHHCMHLKRYDEVSSLLCGMTLLLEGKGMPPSALLGYLLMLKTISEQREYHEKERGGFHK